MAQIPIPYLVIPPLTPLFFVLVMALLDAIGFAWKAHGWLMFWLPAMVAISLVVACVMAFYLVPRALAALVTEPGLRTPKNYLAVGFAALYLLGCAVALYVGNRG